MGRTTSVSVEDLLSHAEWLERLARHLAGGVADDVTQEVWLAAHRAGPDPDRPARPWLAGVLRNVSRTWRRNEARRGVRDRQFQDSLPNDAPGADATYERLELQRLLADRMMALDRPLREVVVLRYFEGLDSREIARITDEPEGTVRWRLKTALDRLRAALDEHHGGDRRRWVAALGLNPGAIFMATTKSKTIIAIAALALVGLVTVSWNLLGPLGRARVRREASFPETSSRAEPDGEGGGVGVASSAPPGSRSRESPALRSFMPPGDLPACRSLLVESSRDLEKQDRVARAFVPSVAFEGGERNAVLHAEVAPQIARFWSGPGGTPPGLSHELECRAWACRLTVRLPGSESDEVGPWIKAITPVMQVKKLRTLKLGQPSPRGIALEVEGWTPMAEEGRGGSLEKFVFYFGAPASDPPRAIGSPAPASASPGDSPATLSDCHTKLDAVRGRARTRQAQLAGFEPLGDRFVGGASNPTLTEKVLAVTEQSFPGPRRPRVECRGDVCRLDFPEPPDPAALAVLGKENAALGGLVQTEPGPTKRAVFLTTVQSGWDVLRGRLEPSRKAGFFASCPEPERPGKILLRLHVPWTGRRNDDGQFSRISMRVLAGALASTPSGVCLAERIGTLVASEELPSPVGDFVRMESWSWAPGSPPQLLDH